MPGGGGGAHDEELRLVGVGPGVGHRDDAAAAVRERPVELVLERLPPNRRSAGARAGRVAALQWHGGASGAWPKIADKLLQGVSGCPMKHDTPPL